MPRDITPENSIAQVRSSARGTLETARAGLLRIQRACDDVGYAALVAHIGGDPAEITTAYDALSALILAIDPTATVPPLQT